jgi:hypothetical protein
LGIQKEEVVRMTEPLFNSACKKRLNKAIEIVDQRGQQYGDTLRDCQWLIFKSVYKTISGYPHELITSEYARALAIAALCDIKYQRFQGGWNEDNIDDGINYQSILPEMIELAIKSYESPEVSAGKAEQSEEI